jgi:hypothetical protein
MSSITSFRFLKYPWLASYILYVCRKRNYVIQNSSQKCLLAKIKINSFKLISKHCLVCYKIIVDRYGDSFDIKYSHNEFFAYETKAYCKERRFKDANFNDLFKY